MVLAYPDYLKVFESYTDASGNLLKAVITQDDCPTKSLRPLIWNLLWTVVQYRITLLVLAQHTDKVNPFLDKCRPIAFFSRNSAIMQFNYSVTNLNY